MDAKPVKGKYNILSAGKYLTAYHIGDWKTIGEAYERLLQYKSLHHMQTEKEYLEFYIVDDFTTKNLEDYVTEISVKIVNPL